jgi:hypothetical protein
MLTIRKEQIDIFKIQAEERFIDKMILHLRKQFPEETATYDDMVLRTRIRNELTSARGFQLVSERSICYYLNLSIMYGEGFIELEDNLWMKDYLTDTEVPDPDERMNRLYRAAIKRLEVEAEHQRILAEFNEPDDEEV